MQNIKYHVINIISVFIFSYFSSAAVTDIARLSLSDTGIETSSQVRRITGKSPGRKREKVTFQHYEKTVLGTGFFKIAGPPAVEENQDEDLPETPLDQLYLRGTITGPYSIARAMIDKGRPITGNSLRQRTRRIRRRMQRRANNTAPGKRIFKLWEKVYGYRLVRIKFDRVYLKSNGKVDVLRIFRKDKNKNKTAKSSASPNKKVSKTISRAELKQKVLGNMDNALRGLVAGPYRKGGKITGYRLKKVKPYNILYRLGARSGDIVKRINGHKVNSTRRLIQMWESLKNDSRISVDILRRSRNIRFSFRITN